MRRHIRSLDAWGLLLGTASLLVLGPLRGLFVAVPLIPFLCAIVLFMAPGALLVHRFLGESFSGVALLPAAFAISTSIFGLLGVPALVLQTSLEMYLLFAGAIVIASLVAAFVALRQRTPEEKSSVADTSSGAWLWVPFVLLSAFLALVTSTNEPENYYDIWGYLAWVRELLNANQLALHEPYFGNEVGLSRARINGWLLEQAALSKLSGIDPIRMVFRYLAPTLVVVSLLGFYALARGLLKKEAAVLLASLYALFFLIYLNDSPHSIGGELVNRIAEDKFVARFVFLPVALALALAFLYYHKLRYLVVFALLSWSVMAVHPVGLAIIGLSVAGFCLFHLAVNLGNRGAWIRAVSLGAVLLGAVLIPAALLFAATGESLTVALKDTDINSNDPDVLANMVFVRSDWKHILELSEEMYIMHPSLVLAPVMVVAFLVGVPFLLRKARRGSLPAQLLLGTLMVPFAACYVPPVATFLGEHVVLPGQLWRLAWPIPVAAVLVVGWMVWEVIERGEGILGRLGLPSRVVAFLPLGVVLALTAAAAPSALAGAKQVYDSRPLSQGTESCFDPIFRWMQYEIREPSVVLAPDAENTCIPAYTAEANVVSLRGASVLGQLKELERRAGRDIEVPQGDMDVRRFYQGVPMREGVRIIRRHDADYVLLRRNSPPDEYLGSLPGFVAVEDAPTERYSLYTVDRRELRR